MKIPTKRMNCSTTTNSVSPGKSCADAVDYYINTDFDIVKLVAENISEIKKVASLIGSESDTFFEVLAKYLGHNIIGSFEQGFTINKVGEYATFEGEIYYCNSVIPYTMPAGSKPNRDFTKGYRGSVPDWNEFDKALLKFAGMDELSIPDTESRGFRLEALRRMGVSRGWQVGVTILDTASLVRFGKYDYEVLKIPATMGITPEGDPNFKRFTVNPADVVPGIVDLVKGYRDEALAASASSSASALASATSADQSNEAKNIAINAAQTSTENLIKVVEGVIEVNKSVVAAKLSEANAANSAKEADASATLAGKHANDADIDRINAERAAAGSENNAQVAIAAKDAAIVSAEKAKDSQDIATSERIEVERLKALVQAIYDGMIGGVVYKGLWDPTTDTYPVDKSVTAKWDVTGIGAGTHTFDGKDWANGDILYYEKATDTYYQIHGNFGVISVDGRAGAVSLEDKYLKLIGGEITGSLSIVGLTSTETFKVYKPGTIGVTVKSNPNYLELIPLNLDGTEATDRRFSIGLDEIVPRTQVRVAVPGAEPKVIAHRTDGVSDISIGFMDRDGVLTRLGKRVDGKFAYSDSDSLTGDSASVIYSTTNKPSPNDLNAVDRNGDTIIGKISHTHTGSVKLPSGTTEQRDGVEAGNIRFNIDDQSFEGSNGFGWAPIGSGKIQYTIYTSEFQIVKGKGHLVDTRIAGIIATLPVDPKHDDFIVIGDLSGKADVNPIRIKGFNGHDLLLDRINCVLTITYVRDHWAITDGVGESGSANLKEFTKRLSDLEKQVEANNDLAFVYGLIL
ncbi:MAG: hypothetical protein ACRCR2_02225 [Fusobacteriaceae bacterium]